VIVQYEYTLEDLNEAGRAHAKAMGKGFEANRSRLPRQLFWVASIGLAVVFFMLMQRNTPIQGTPPIIPPPNQSPYLRILVLIIPGLLMVGYIWFLLRSRSEAARRVWDNEPSLQLRRTLDADRSRVIIDNGQTRIERKWNSFRRFIESPNLFLLYTSDYAFDIVPKRAFASPAQVDEFRRLLEQQIQPPTGGFPVQPPGTT
jgi:hypothetical protein